METFHKEILVVQEAFEKSLSLTEDSSLKLLVHEIAYANYHKDYEYLKELIAKFKKKDYNINVKYNERINGVYDEESVISQHNKKSSSLTIEDCLSQIGYAESSIKKLIKDFKNTELEGNKYIIAVLNTIPSRSKYKKPSLEIIKKLEMI